MNFFLDKELALRFKNNAVPSKERVFYFLGIFIYYSILFWLLEDPGYLIKNHSEEFSNLPICNAIGSKMCLLVLDVLGVLWCYRSNKLGDDKEFIERITCLSFPITTQVTLITLITVVILAVLFFVMACKFYVSMDKISIYFSYLTLLLIMIFPKIYYYIKLNSSIKLASN